MKMKINFFNLLQNIYKKKSQEILARARVSHQSALEALTVALTPAAMPFKDMPCSLPIQDCKCGGIAGSTVYDRRSAIGRAVLNRLRGMRRK